MAWHTGDIWQPQATITNPKATNPAEPVDPGSVIFTFESPKGRTTTPTVSKLSTGLYESSQELTEDGEWKVSVTTTAPYKASQPAQIPVKPAFNE